MGDKILTILGLLIVLSFSLGLLFLVGAMENPDIFSSAEVSDEIIIYIASYFVMAGSLTVILKKRSYEYYWAGLIPVFQLVAILGYLGKPLIWFFFTIIPIVNIFFLIYLFAAFLNRLDKHPFSVILFLIPGINYLYWIYLAFTTETVETKFF